MSESEQVYSANVTTPNRMEVYHEYYGYIFECYEIK